MNTKHLMQTLSRWLPATLLLTLTACSTLSLETLAGRPAALPTISADLPQQTQAVLRDYDVAIAALRKEYYDSAAVDKPWLVIANAEREKLVKDGSVDQFVASLQATFEALGAENEVQMQMPAAPVTATLGGIGVIVDLPRAGKDRVLVINVLSGSPAERAGIRAHDSIVDVDGAPVKGEDGVANIRRILGKPDTKVALTVETPGKASRTLTLTRKVIQRGDDVLGAIGNLVGDTRVAYVMPMPGSGDTMRDGVANVVRTLSGDERLNGIVLDLRTMRDYDFPIDQMLSLFVSGDKLGNVEDRNDLRVLPARTPVAITGKSIRGSQDMPMIVLVSELTEGPAESFAGLLQDLGRARIFGMKTKGRTSVMTTLQLPASGLEMRIPTGRYVGVKGSQWRGVGVTPDVTIDERFEDYTEDSDTQLRRAIEEIQK
jgi:C-terminal peptidase prc